MLTYNLVGMYVIDTFGDFLENEISLKYLSKNNENKENLNIVSTERDVKVILNGHLLICIKEKAEQLMVLRLSGAGLGSCCGQSRTGRRLPLDLDLVFVYSVLDGCGGVIGAAVLEQPVQNLVSFC